jgi:hypothetical protein
VDDTNGYTKHVLDCVHVAYCDESSDLRVNHVSAKEKIFTLELADYTGAR